MTGYVLTNCVVSILALGFIWFRLFAALRRDNYRSDIRRIRDELFDFMWKNGHDFDAASYCATRQTLNGLLRMSNTMTATRFVVFAFLHARYDIDRGPDHLDRETNKVLKQRLKQAKYDAVARLLRFVFLEGIKGLVIKALLLCFGAIHLLTRVKKWAKREGNSMFWDAYKFGAPHLSLEDRSILKT